MRRTRCAGAELESELEARQRQNPPESLRGVHEQVIRLVDNMVQNYLGNVRRTVQRMTQFIDNRRTNNSSTPRDASSMTKSKVVAVSAAGDPSLADTDNNYQYTLVSRSILHTIDDLSKQMQEFNAQWLQLVGRQQSPLYDRIPPRGIELWVDFRNTVIRQVRRINQEFRQLSQDMARMITGRLPSSRGPTPGQPAAAALSYSASTGSLDAQSFTGTGAERLTKIFQEFHDRMSAALGEEQKKMDSLRQTQSLPLDSPENTRYYDQQQQNLIDEQEDQQTKDELSRNVALRQQIQNEVNVFSSIFDIMRAFIQRLRE